MATNIERDVRFLKRYAVVTSTLLILLSAAAFTRSTQYAKFDEIDVERINVREPNGNYRMVISNRPRSIGPIYKNKPFGYAGGGRPGIIFFNDEGTENGGLTFTGQRGADGKYRASTHMSFDQFNQDQVLNLDYNDNNGQRLVGLSVNDAIDLDILDLVTEKESIMKMTDTVARAAALKRWGEPRNGVPMGAQRLFVGKDRSKSAILNLSDRDGKARLRLVVDSLGGAHIDFLDATGRVTNSVTGASARGGR